MRDGYDPARPNLIVVLTDGADSDHTPLRQEQFKQDVQRLADPTRPIRVVLIGIGVSPPTRPACRRSPTSSAAGFFPLTSPEQIQTIFLRALLRVGTDPTPRDHDSVSDAQSWRSGHARDAVIQAGVVSASGWRGSAAAGSVARGVAAALAASPGRSR